MRRECMLSLGSISERIPVFEMLRFS